MVYGFWAAPTVRQYRFVNPTPGVVANRDVGVICSTLFYGRQEFYSCSGSCASRFHLSFLQFSQTEYACYTEAVVSTWKCPAYVNNLRCQRNDNKSVKPHSSPMSDIPNKTFSTERVLLLTQVFHGEKYPIRQWMSSRIRSVLFVSAQSTSWDLYWTQLINLGRMSLALRVIMPSSSHKLQLMFDLGSQETSLRGYHPSASVRRHTRTSLTQLTWPLFRNLTGATHTASTTNESVIEDSVWTLHQLLLRLKFLLCE
jgi:hypothetical protein